MKFALEVENWTEYELVKEFSSFDRAKRYGLERFAQNNFRVINRGSNLVDYEHDPFEVIQREATGELNRFHQNEKWRLAFAERRADEVRTRQEQERVAERNARNRTQQTTLDGQRRVVVAFRDVIPDNWWDERNQNHNPVTEKVNWLKEGF